MIWILKTGISTAAPKKKIENSLDKMSINYLKMS